MGSEWRKRNMLGVVKQKDPGREWRIGFLDVFKGVKKGSLRDSNADSKSPPRICDYYIAIKKKSQQNIKPLKTNTGPKQKKLTKKTRSHMENLPVSCVSDHKQSLVNVVSIDIQICMPCFWVANSSPLWGELCERFWK